MKRFLKVLILVTVLIAATAALIMVYLEMRQERDMEAAGEEPIIAPSRVRTGADGWPELVLDAATQQRLGLRLEIPARGFVDLEITATARVLPGPDLMAMVHEVSLGEAGLPAVRSDYERKKKLFESGQNASAAAVETAEAVLREKELALAEARDRIGARWGPAVAGRSDLVELAGSLMRREAALVQIDWLDSQVGSSLPKEARLLDRTGTRPSTALVLGPAPSADPSFSGTSLLALVTTNAAWLIPGSWAEARLPQGRRLEGFVLPPDAVVRHQGLAWCYLQTGPETFRRGRFELDHAHDRGWLVTGEEIRPVVVAGTQSLLSEELKAGIQMKD